MRPTTPRGFRDILTREARERDQISRSIIEALAAWGYSIVETPIVEEYTTLQVGVGKSLQGTVFPFVDTDGTLLALRPEMSVPIARLAATRLSQSPGPHRLSYSSEVFREQVSLRGQARQFTQVGLELIGASGPVADAEVVGTLVESLRATGLRGFVVAVGTVEVLRSIITSSDMDSQWKDAVIEAAQKRNLVAIDLLAAREGLDSAVASALRVVPRLRGGREVIAECSQVAGSFAGVAAALDLLGATWDLLEASGVQEFVSIDLGTMRSFDYYAGMVLEVFAPQLGVAIGGGGRYDPVMSEFGDPCPAAGFALGLERVHIALSEQGGVKPSRALDAVLGGEAQQSFVAAAKLRAAGWRVRLACGDRASVAEEGPQFAAKLALWASADGVVVLGSDASVTGTLSEPFGEPPSQAERESEVRS
ncbi:MAG: ATP phosphoribosyltransferase regulatory subunit [Actinobacteria bacterium]|nr:ATP phosphoribosyltransferase regulatory subunit [Actinomycetota bacterium]